jgi:hypothetical protein
MNNNESNFKLFDDTYLGGCGGLFYTMLKVNLIIKVSCFVKEKNIDSVWKNPDLN